MFRFLYNFFFPVVYFSQMTILWHTQTVLINCVFVVLFYLLCEKLSSGFYSFIDLYKELHQTLRDISFKKGLKTPNYFYLLSIGYYNYEAKVFTNKYFEG